MRAALAAAILAGGCAGDEADDTGTAPALTACEGAGAGAIEVGTGGQAAFAPWADGDTVEIVDGGGRYGFAAELLSTGLDTTAPVSTFLRFSVADETATTDAGASLSLQCSDGATGWAGVFAPLGDTWQDPARLSELDGAPLRLTVLATDQGAETAQTAVELVIEVEAR